MMKIMLHIKQLKKMGFLKSLLKKKFNKDLITVLKVKRRNMWGGSQGRDSNEILICVCLLLLIGSDFLELIVKVYWMDLGFQRLY